MYIGRLSHRKGPHVADRALSKCSARRGREVRLDLSGAVFPGNEAYEEGLREQANAKGVSGQRAVPRLPALDLAHRRRQSTSCVISSVVDEPFGNTAVEASLGARPLVVSDIAGLKEASQAATSAIRVPAGDAEALADAVRNDRGRLDEVPRLPPSAMPEPVADRFSAAQYGRALLDACGLPPHA